MFIIHTYFQHREKIRRARKAQEAHAKAAKEQGSMPDFSSGGMPGGMPGGIPGMGGFNSQDFMKLLSDPEIVAAFKVNMT